MGKTLRVLIVEDSEDDALILLRTLVKGGYEPIHQRVFDAKAMSDQLDTAIWDIIISDYSMPNFDGLNALKVLKQKQLDLPFIIVSGVIGEETAVEAMKAGAHDYVMKGNLSRLIPAIERELREAAERGAHRAAEDEVRKLSRALAQSTGLVMITSPLGIIEYINAAFTGITGYTATDLLGQHWDILRLKQDAPGTQASFREALEALDEWHGELHTITKFGNSLWLALSLSPIRNMEDEISQLLFVAEDITIRKKLETELVRYNEHLEQMVEERTSQLQQERDRSEVILNASSDAIVLALPNGDIEKSNPAFKRLFGEHVSWNIERLLWSLPNDQFIEMVGKAFLSVIYDKSEQRIETSIVTEDNRKIDGDLVVVPVNQTDEDKSGLLLSLRDISPLKEIERFKARFVASAAHDLGNPIAVLKMRLYMLERMPEQLDKHVDVLKKQISRLEHLVDELRTLSLLDQGRSALSLQPVDLNMLITAVIEAQQPTALAKEQQLIFQPAEGLPVIQADLRKIERVVVNLVANALNYTPNGGVIWVVSCFTPTSIIFTVKDTGMGIGEDDLPHIFERFYRTSRAQDSGSTGTGLGLAIVKEIIDLHSGKISVNSQIDVGTVFTVELSRNILS